MIFLCLSFYVRIQHYNTFSTTLASGSSKPKYFLSARCSTQGVPAIHQPLFSALSNSP